MPEVDCRHETLGWGRDALMHPCGNLSDFVLVTMLYLAHRRVRYVLGRCEPEFHIVISLYLLALLFGCFRGVAMLLCFFTKAVSHEDCAMFAVITWLFWELTPVVLTIGVFMFMADTTSTDVWRDNRGKDAAA